MNNGGKKGSFAQKATSFGIAAGKVFTGTATPKDWTTFLKYIIPVALGGVVFALLIFALIFGLLYAPVMTVVEYVKSAANSFVDWVEGASNWLQGNGWYDNETAFQEALKNKYKYYRERGVRIQTSYVMAVLNMKYISEQEYELGEDISEENYDYLDQSEVPADTEATVMPFGQMIPDMKRLVEHMVHKEYSIPQIDGGVLTLTNPAIYVLKGVLEAGQSLIDLKPNNVKVSNENYLSYLRYGNWASDNGINTHSSEMKYEKPTNEEIEANASKYKNGYISRTFSRSLADMDDIDRAYKVESIINDIYNYAKSIEDLTDEDVYGYGYYAYNCPGVMLTGDYAGTYPLEEYVAGVVKNENGGAGIEGLKTQAILARTYVLKVTNNCTTSINNSESQQTFSPATEDIYIQAANETAGQVLSYNGELVSTYYASYPQAGYNGFPSFPACGSVDCDSENCTTTFYKMPNVEPFTFTMPIRNSQGNYWNGAHLQNQSGHCYGFSQVAGRYLESTGVDHIGMINTFYSEGVVINNPSLFSSGGWQIRENAPTINDYLYTGYSNIGQCVWYAKSRAMEILTELMDTGKIDSNKAQAAIDSLRSTTGNATDWYNNTSNSFKKSSDPSNPQAGSIIVWSGGCNHSYGHVAIIEEINNEEGTITITDSYSNRKDVSSCPKSWDCIVFRNQTYDLEYFFNNYLPTGGGSCKNFVGYVNFIDSDF